MLKPQAVGKTHEYAAKLNAFVHGRSSPTGASSLAVISRLSLHRKQRELGICFISSTPAGNIEAVASAPTTKKETTSVEHNEEIDEAISETIKGFAQKKGREGEVIKYETTFKVGKDFGEVGAILVENEHRREMYLTDIVLHGFPNGPVNVVCNSWVHSKFQNPQKRVFFTTKSYLPRETPSGLRRLRKEELETLRGNGEGERKSFERIYDYDVYNDVGDPDKSWDLRRPVLGGQLQPYPRRCRTGRAPCDTDPLSEKRTKKGFYVPRDECFSEIKQVTFSAKTLYSVLHALAPSLGTVMVDKDLGFTYFTAIDSLFSEGVDLPPIGNQGFLKTIIPRVVKTITDTGGDVLRFETLRPLTEWPLKSKLDPEIYGPQESAITTEMINQEIGGIMTVDEALKQNKLFILDYHDLLLPFVERVRQLKSTTLYGSRTVFFLNPDGTLRPLAIELTRPPMDGLPKPMFLPMILVITNLLVTGTYSTLRTHCVTEPYVIATNRQLSVMHPIHRLLRPHFRYTMEINALAREALINAEGTIETAFAPGKYAGELSSVAYDVEWRFDLQALPADLISRARSTTSTNLGMAVEDPTAPHGLKLTIEDYPYANDGLLLWDIIKQWVSDYVDHYYPDPNLVEFDEELQAWWSEIRTVGHADKKDEPWWPVLKTSKDLIEIVTTIVWVTSGHHAAVNFGQYTYAGYFPNRPAIARINMPTEDPSEEDWKRFMKKPEAALLKNILEKMEKSWEDNPVIKAAFEKFNGRLKVLEGIIDERNENSDFKNRNGAGTMPYELLKPFSQPGVTGKGVPYSISI
ncbi:hypothetical protein FNV43_RR03019 [Rhamnella rubrinervis]|uniref:Lipoxygenase n=1 Tax=Rhamnella rubrinervis TaxID=2594499 RepID=A0A8K0MNA9_9ROSA|nr:hypothetical protein FNV43_RR03019 [Rhamnella rubrinervis]